MDKRDGAEYRDATIIEQVLFNILWCLLVLVPPVIAGIFGPFIGFLASIVAFGLCYTVGWWHSKLGFRTWVPLVDFVTILILGITFLACAIVLLLKLFVPA